jgi:hypothetical protein
MIRFTIILAVGFGLWAFGLKAQPMPPAPKLIVRFASYRVIGNTLQIVVATNKVHGVPVPPRTNFTLSVSSPGDLQMSEDGLHWSEYGFCWTNLLMTNDFSTMALFREVSAVNLSWAPMASLSVTNYRVTECCMHAPLGWRKFDVGLACTNIFIPYLAGDCSNYFCVCSMDIYGNISSNSAPVGCLPGTRTITIQ